jgi:hypothetical protein
MTSPEVPPKPFLRRIKNDIVDIASITKQGVQDIRKGEGYLGEKVKAVSDKIEKTKSMLDTLGEQAAKIEKVPAVYKIVFLMFFYIFFYKIFYDIGVFFGLNNLEMIIYMTWFGMILFFASFISVRRSRLK